jgi:lipopolysaccharide/colanic/teichoic acid biosynthesis glycosyltransferase
MWNVLIGDMSVVGPRPLLMRYVARYDAFQARRMEVRPGVTGWAQINGRNSLSWEEKFALDVWYVDNRSFWLDMKIVGLTFFRVLARSGAERPASAPPLEEFRGSLKD